jgi:CBS domain
MATLARAWQRVTRNDQVLLFFPPRPGLLRATHIRKVMRPQVATVSLDTQLEQLTSLFLHRHLPIFVVDDGKLYGSIEFADLADAAFDPEQEKPPTARDLVHRTPVALVPEDDSRRRFACARRTARSTCRWSTTGGTRVIGEIRYQDLVSAYDRALLAARAAERGES